jgi:hypothetical protein
MPMAMNQAPSRPLDSMCSTSLMAPMAQKWVLFATKPNTAAMAKPQIAT